MREVEGSAAQKAANGKCRIRDYCNGQSVGEFVPGYKASGCFLSKDGA
jgi:hypothetical protein